MKKLYDSVGFVYIGFDGDELVVIIEFYEFFKFMGMEVFVVGKGKNNKFKISVNFDSC